jgi:hypothetical protein
MTSGRPIAHIRRPIRQKGLVVQSLTRRLRPLAAAVTCLTYVLTRGIRVLSSVPTLPSAAMFQCSPLRGFHFGRNNLVSYRLARYQQSNISACRGWVLDANSSLAQRKMRAAECHHGAETERRQARKHT